MALPPNYTTHRKDFETLEDYFFLFKEHFDKPPKNIIEFGVDTGGSLLLFNDFLAPDKIYGYDFSFQPWIKDIIENHKLPIELISFRQNDLASLCQSESDLPEGFLADLIIDDCSHDHDATIETLHVFWPRLKPGGCYVIEDYRANDDLKKLADPGYWQIYLPALCEVFVRHSMIIIKKRNA